MKDTEDLRRILRRIYPAPQAAEALEKILPLLERRRPAAAAAREYFSERDVVLITYGDTLREEGRKPLEVFGGFARKYLRDVFATIHFLPFFPYSSDDGFSVLDYYRVDPALGRWEDIRAVGRDFKLMFDFVLNHVSAGSAWFARFLAGAAGWEDLAIEVDPHADLSAVVRPRSLPLLTAFQKADGRPVHVWTTFSADQIDLNYKSCAVLERMLRVLLFYVEQGAAVLRLDAVAYLWKEIGTSCIHLPQTHDVVRLLRCVLDYAAPQVVLLTETNVPHAENISYFGNGRDEAQMVYNFTLPPLLLDACLRRDAARLSEWARGLQPASSMTTFFNFTASHDGIGIRPLEGILPSGEVAGLVAAARRSGGDVSHKDNPDGSRSPYELNVTYVDALAQGGTASEELLPELFLASQAVALVLPGVPAVYIHSLLGSRNWTAGVAQTGRARTINRAKLTLPDVVNELGDPRSLRARIFHPYCAMIRVRRAQPAFHPAAAHVVLDLDSRLFALMREGGGQRIYALTNLSPDPVGVTLEACSAPRHMFELLSGRELDTADLRLEPYGRAWLSGLA